jgi:hypothetical protein
MSKFCIICLKNPAIKHPTLGWLSCMSCRSSSKKLTMPVEFTLDSVKQSRKEYAKDILQSSRDGVLSKERLEAYGTKGLKVTEEQIKNARYVWDDIKPYKEGNPDLI